MHQINSFQRKYNLLGPRIILVLFFKTFLSVLISQNLIPNPSFEDQNDFPKDMLKDECYSNAYYLKNWTQSGFINNIYYLKDTKLNCAKVDPQNGNAMICLKYIESCPFEPPFGCANYLSAKLISPLEIGELYKLTYWVYAKENAIVEKTWLNCIGAYLSLENKKMKVHEMLETEYFFGDTLEMGKWIKVEKNIKALCNLKYITLGIFKNESFPILHRRIPNDALVFFDNISLEKINLDQNIKNIEYTAYCSYFQKTELAIETNNLEIYFDKNEFNLSSKNQEFLEKQIKSKKKFNSITLEGYADIDGTEIFNQNLAEKRIVSIASYFAQKYNLDSNAIIKVIYGEKFASQIEQQKWNDRKVEITFYNKNQDELLYDKIILAARNNEIPKALKLYHSWINITSKNNRIISLFDPRLINLRSLSEFNIHISKIRKSYPSNISFSLDSLYFADQQYRTLEQELKKLSKIKPEPTLKNDSNNSLTLKQIDQNNLVYLTNKLLANTTLPKISQIGIRPAKAILLVLNHAQNLEIIKKNIALLEQYCLIGEADWTLYANLYDKMKKIENLPQYFGTQFNNDTITNGYEIYKYDNMDSVNRRRIKIGLDRLFILK
ncbi:MAG: OmpA family protein [Saprospiraceae bacterium]